MKLTKPEFDRLKAEDQEEYLAFYGQSFEVPEPSEEEKRATSQADLIRQQEENARQVEERLIQERKEEQERRKDEEEQLKRIVALHSLGFKLTEQEEALRSERIEREKALATPAMQSPSTGEGHALLKATSILIPGVGLIAGAVMIGDEKRGKLGSQCLTYAIVSMIVFLLLIFGGMALSDYLSGY